MHILKNSLMYGSSWDTVGVVLWRTFIDTICNITKEPQRFNCACGSIGKSAVKISSIALKSYINEKSRFDQLATDSSSRRPDFVHENFLNQAHSFSDSTYT